MSPIQRRIDSAVGTPSNLQSNGKQKGVDIIPHVGHLNSKKLKGKASDSFSLCDVYIQHQTQTEQEGVQAAFRLNVWMYLVGINSARTYAFKHGTSFSCKYGKKVKLENTKLRHRRQC